MRDELQFYPTPEALARKAWSLFDNQSVSRVLEPSAGRGDLLFIRSDDDYDLRFRGAVVDTIEINIEHHPVLRDKGCRVVATDFLSYASPVLYSHIIMNPPFNKGVDHVLHAWDLLRDGELVAIINAETIKNPFSEKRKHLVRLIEDHGSVEFVQSAFEDPDSLRRTAVEVALVHLTRKTGIDIDINAFGLKEDQRDEVVLDDINPLALPESSIRNTVRAFNAAVKAMEASVKAEAIAGYYQGLIKVDYHGGGCGEVDADKVMHGYVPFSGVAKAISKRYDELKEHAWRRVFNSTDFTSRFSQKVQQSIQSQLSTLMEMEFTVENIHAVLEGLIESKTELDFQMFEEIFDEITRYHSDNREHYRGWKSNDKHKLGFKIRSTRFILPCSTTWSGDDIDWDMKRKLADFDRCFAMLDQKQTPNYGLVDAFKHERHDLLTRDRVSTDYFDLRFYAKAGTLHFFPTRKDLIDRLNRIVGKRRQWLPPEPSGATDSFWRQYEEAAKVQKQMDKLLEHVSCYRRFDDETVYRSHQEACDNLGYSLDQLVADHGPDDEFRLTCDAA